MPRGIDHLVLCTHDLIQTRAVYDRIGLTTTPDAHHPFGTGNFLVQLDGCFLEILTVTRPERIPSDADNGFHFATFNRDFIAKGNGMSMLVLDSIDEKADRADFDAKGLQSFAPFDFQRQAKLPDGSEATVGFSLTFTADPALPGLGFFTCKQWRPDLFWKPDYQRHDIGATSVAEVLLVTDDIDHAAAFLGKFADAPVSQRIEGEKSVNTSRGRLTALTPQRFRSRFADAGLHVDTDRPYFGGFVLDADADAAKRRWQDNGLPVRDGNDGPWLGGELGLGYIIAAE